MSSETANKAISVSATRTVVGDATVIRDEDVSQPLAVSFSHVRKTYKLFAKISK